MPRPPTASLMAPPCSGLSRARSVPLEATVEAEESSPAQSLAKETSNEAEARATGSFTTTHYTVVATDCRRSALLMSSANFQSKRRGSGLSNAQTSSTGSFGGNDADHEDNVDEEEDFKQPIITVEGTNSLNNMGFSFQWPKTVC